MAKSSAKAVLPQHLREQIGARLGAHAAAHGATQAQIAVECNLSRQAVNHWFKGRNLPELAQLYRIAAKWHLSVDAILFGHPIYTPDILKWAAKLSSMSEPERRLLEKLFGR